MDKVIITVVGEDTIGIMSKVCNVLADLSVNILDVSQSILDGYFNMIMMVDVDKCTCSHKELVDKLSNLGDEIGVQIKAQREQIFKSMHRV